MMRYQGYGMPIGVYNGYPRGSIFSSIGNFLGGAVHAVSGVVSHLGIPGVSGIAGVVSGLTGGSTPAAPPVQPFQGGLVNIGGGGVAVPSPFGNIGLGTGPGSFGYNPLTAGLSPGTGMTPYQGDTALAVLGKYKGYHLNKSTYVRRRGGLQLVQKHTIPVKNRHLNPGNGRAAQRALRRLHAFSRMARKIYTITHPKPGSRHHFKRKGRKR